MNMEERFWRLLSVLETLARHGTVALRERNFGYLAWINATKSAILPEWCELASALGIGAGDERLKARLMKLMETLHANARLANCHLEANAAARQEAQSALRRIEGVGKTYRGDLSGRTRSAYAA